MHKCNDDVYKVPIPSCSVISEISKKTKKIKYRVFVFKNRDFKRSMGKKRYSFNSKKVLKIASLLVSGAIKSKKTLLKLDNSNSWESVSSIKQLGLKFILKTIVSFLKAVTKCPCQV